MLFIIGDCIAAFVLMFFVGVVGNFGLERRKNLEFAEIAFGLAWMISTVWIVARLWWFR